jgi:polyhydroxyalkanoate synthase
MSTETDDLAAPLDALLVDSAFGPLRRFLPSVSTAKFAAALASRPVATGRTLGALAARLVRVGAGADDAAGTDKRFADPAWTQNPLLRRALQSYLAVSATVAELVDASDLPWRDDQRVRFLAENLVQALSPSNAPLLNPAALRAAVDSGGLNFIRGGLNLVRDMATAPRIPSMVDGSQFTVGENLAATPGAVVLRTEVFELIQYVPQTPTVRRVPVLFVPPTINKFYVLDLAPGRSWIEYLVQSGQQVFVLSWRNPDARHAAWDVDTYVSAVIEALDGIERICRVDRTVLVGACSGGILTTLVAARLASEGALRRLAGITLAVTVLDFRRAGLPAALADRYLAAAATAMSRRRGYLDGRVLAEVFAWLRPGDLIWHYWVNNYLLGRPPPAFDVLFWNADTTRMTASLHAGFIDLALNGIGADLRAVDVDTYVIAGVSDHITPWQSCYASTQMLGGHNRFVLSTSGHIAALVNPPGNVKAGYQVGPANPADPQDWSREADTRQGSWWPDFADWLGERCGPHKKAPKRLGGGRPPLVEAPGTYVFDR